jgi:hypothetical protein
VRFSGATSTSPHLIRYERVRINSEHLIMFYVLLFSALKARVKANVARLLF